MMAADALSDFRLPFDEALFSAVNGLKSPALDTVFVLASSPVFGGVALALAAAWLVGNLRGRFLYGLVPLIVAVGVSDFVGHRLLKPLFGRLRPAFALPKDQVRVLVEIANSGSLPSLHAANAFAAATVLTLLVPRGGFVAVPVALLIALSRVGVGVHWPSDVFAGALFGVALGVGAVTGTQRVFGRWGVADTTLTGRPGSPPP